MNKLMLEVSSKDQKFELLLSVQSRMLNKVVVASSSTCSHMASFLLVLHFNLEVQVS